MATKKSKEKPRWAHRDLMKEEVRGIFTIGVLTLLFMIRSNYGKSALTVFLGKTLTVSNATDFLFIYWGAYILFICVALSDDFINPRLLVIPRIFKDIAGAMFVLGVFFLLVVGFMILWQVILVILVITLGPALAYRLKKRRGRSRRYRELAQ